MNYGVKVANNASNSIEFSRSVGGRYNIHIYIYMLPPPPKDLPKSMPSETFLVTFIPTVQIMMTQTGGGHVKTCAYPGFTQMFQTGQ